MSHEKPDEKLPKPARRRTPKKPATERRQPITEAKKPSADPKPRAKRAPRAPSTAEKRSLPAKSRKPRAAAVVRPDALSVLMVTSEAHPFAKTGGLAEVAAALTDALARMGHTVTLVLPRYKSISVDGASRLQTRLRLGDRLQPITFYEQPIAERATAVFVDVPELFDRDGLYGTPTGDYPDNVLRFGVFDRAAIEYPRLKQWRPSIIHAHDWQAGLVPVYQKMHLSSDPFVGGVPVVFTIHNLAFQGVFPASNLPQLGLGWEVLDVQAMEFWGNISFLKGGINFSEKITTVSPGYAKEIVRPELGFGFEGVLARRSADLVGILNGIDTSRWTPAADAFVPASFNVDDLSGKIAAKRALLADVGLPVNNGALARPAIGLISRLTDQKGFDLIAAAAPELMSLDVTWVLLGSGERRFEDIWRTLAARHPDRVSATIGFDERLAHFIEAGSDMFLMPSRFEPCGLNQMYSLRYGTLPIVRATGGLDDTVVDVDDPSGEGTGFKFTDYTPGALLATVRRAVAAFGEKDRWRQAQQRGMRRDYSWDASALEYVKLYRR
jgi:starch synthase